MENSIQLANRFREVLLNGKWIANTNYKDQLFNVTWEEANHKIGSLNTIAALTYHINYYIKGILKFFEKGTLDIQDKYSFDAPQIRSQQDWEERLNSLWANAEQFANQVEQMPAEKLEAIFVKEQYGSYRRNIEAVIEHSYYHLGQISLLRKLIKEDGR
jgi:uncharacterized damage-inducible protein DinB